MAVNEGLYWFNGPNELAQRMSLAAGALKGTARDVVNTVSEHAVERMTDIVNAGGMNKTAKGGARVKTGQMIDSIGSKTDLNGRGRVQSEFGFINGPPDWTIFQEQGTIGAGKNKAAHGGSGGIASMLAYATAHYEATVELTDQVQSTSWFPSMKI